MLIGKLIIINKPVYFLGLLPFLIIEKYSTPKLFIVISKTKMKKRRTFSWYIDVNAGEKRIKMVNIRKIPLENKSYFPPKNCLRLYSLPTLSLTPKILSQ
jgi:hypothetical protein